MKKMMAWILILSLVLVLAACEMPKIEKPTTPTGDYEEDPKGTENRGDEVQGDSPSNGSGNSSNGSSNERPSNPGTGDAVNPTVPPAVEMDPTVAPTVPDTATVEPTEPGAVEQPAPTVPSISEEEEAKPPMEEGRP